MTSPGRARGRPSRQPLRIPAGWTVEHNELMQLEPTGDAEDVDFWSNFSEDLLLFREQRRNFLLDVGWYPGGESEGGFRAVLLRGEDWDNPLRTFKTRSLGELVSQIEEWLLVPEPR